MASFHLRIEWINVYCSMLTTCCFSQLPLKLMIRADMFNTCIECLTSQPFGLMNDNNNLNMRVNLGLKIFMQTEPRYIDIFVIHKGLELSSMRNHNSLLFKLLKERVWHSRLLGVEWCSQNIMIKNVIGTLPTRHQLEARGGCVIPPSQSFFERVFKLCLLVRLCSGPLPGSKFRFDVDKMHVMILDMSHVHSVSVSIIRHTFNYFNHSDVPFKAQLDIE